jgi:hypothetical protein
MKITKTTNAEYRIIIKNFSFDENRFPFILNRNNNVKHICLQYLKYIYGIEKYYTE